MASFPDWWVKYRGQAPKQYTYVCGEEPVLVEAVSQHIIKQLNPTPNNLLGLRAGVTPEADIWTLLEHLAIDPTSAKLVVVRDAEKLTDWHRLEEIVKYRRYAPQNHAVFLSNEKRLPQVEDEEGVKSLAPHVAALRKSGQHIVQCIPFTQATAKTAVEWVQSMIPVKPNVAGHLLNRAAGDLKLVRDACMKLDALQVDVTISMVNKLMPQMPGDNFVDSLLKLEKTEALRWAPQMFTRDIPRVLGQLDSQLSFLQDLNRMQSNQMGYGDMMREMRAKAFLVREFLPAARHYDEKSVARRRGMLAGLDSQLRKGWPEALLEAIVLNW